MLNNDLAVQTRGQKQAANASVEEIVANTYARQVLDITLTAAPSSSGNVSSLKGDNVAVSIETMEKIT